MPMTRPTKHPKTGTYLIRLTIPVELRETAKRVAGVQRELRENLRTKDATEARQRAPEALARLRAVLDRVGRVHSAEPPEPQAKDIAALAGVWYRRKVGANHMDESQRDFHLEIALELFDGQPLDKNEIGAIAAPAAEDLLR